MSEIESTKAHFAIEKDGIPVFWTSHRGGVSPVMLAILAHGDDLTGSAVRCRRIGEAAARLLVKSSVAEVNADVLSEPAFSMLKQAGVTLNVRNVFPATSYTDDRGEIGLDELSGKFPDTDSLFEELRARMLRAVYRAERPTDSLLLDERSPRLGKPGGGGT